MYPKAAIAYSWCFKRTLLLVDSEHDDDLIAADSDELLDRPNTTSGKFGEENHAVDVVVLEQFYIGTHVGDLEGHKPSQRS